MPSSASPPLRCSATAALPDGTQALGVPVCAGLEPAGGAWPEAVAGAIDPAYCSARGFSGRAGEILVLPAAGGTTVVALGLGARAKVDAEALRRAGAALVRACRRNSSAAFLLHGALPPALSPAAGAQAVTEGAMLGAYRFGEFKREPEPWSLATLVVVAGAGAADLEDVAAGVERGVLVAGAVSLARDLVNRPAGSMTPRDLAEAAERLAADAGLAVEVWDEPAIAAGGLGGLTGVAQGSEEPARLVKLVYEPSGAAAGDGAVPTVALVGKGITFDAGGLSIKTAEGMMTMKTDMAGAAAVLGALSVLGALRPAVRVLAFLPLTENMPGGGAIKPGDVVRIRNSKTIEVLNTDAEGRLVLADALSLAVEAGADAIVDLATLTGACVVALGRRIAGLMGNHEGLVEQVRAASDRAGEPTWRLPLPEEYRKHIESDVADMKNIGAPGQAGALSAGLILSEFVGDVPWAHLDIAGPARSDAEDGYLTKGGTGYGVRTLVELLSSFQLPAPPAGD